MSVEDKSIFLEAMKDVKPLNTTKKNESYNPKAINAAQKSVLKRVKRKANLEQKKQTTLETEKDFSTSKVSAFESILYHQKGIRLQELSKLKKGEFSIQAVLDLHGFTQDTAEQQIIEFVSHCYHEKYRFIRIIHGKGYNSEDEYPILKNLVNQLLRQIKVIIAFASTPEKDGGTGAVNLFLKAH
ncbi:Smr/MutS family protein [Thiomicrorhabdus sp. Milos-T2]|uniref:Smr/MutS family protein n=1 Tax=Thiomicrorhabdus sp. Milos-T2 TaxID=90814 RepID=UPI00068C37F3|nr:Smr/MutS family protein [Thiomicrorhabdus sp. Milos-T2]